MTARLWNLDDGESFDLQVISSRWGLGLGGSGGAVAVLGFGFSVPYELDGKSSNDWGVNTAITEKVLSKSLITSFTVAVAMARAGKATGIAKMSVEMLASIRNLSHTIFAGYEVSKRSGSLSRSTCRKLGWLDWKFLLRISYAWYNAISPVRPSTPLVSTTERLWKYLSIVAAIC